MSDLNRYQNKKFLIVDDFAEFRTSLSNMLISLGAKEIDTAVNAEKAIELYQKHKHDVILCDYNLGDTSQDGQQLLEELNYREILRKDSIFIMVTAENSIEMVMGAIEFKPDSYLTKPFTKQSLKTRLDKVYEKKQYLLPVLSELNKQDYISAVKVCNQMLKSKHRYASNCLQIKGDCLLRLGLYQQAASVYHSINKQRPLLWSLIGFAKAQMGSGHFEQANRYFEKIISLNQHAVNALDLQAECLLALGEDEKAFEVLEQAVKISSKSISRLRLYADLAVAMTQYSIALMYYKKVIQLSKNSVSGNEEDIFKLLNTYINYIKTLNGSQLSKSKNELQSYIKNYQQTHKSDLQFITALEITKCIYLHYLGNEQDVTNYLTSICKNLTSLTDTRVFLKEQLSYFINHFPQIVQSAPIIADYCKNHSLIKSARYDPLLANKLYQQGLIAFANNKLIEAADNFRKASILSPQNITIALLLMTVLTRICEKQKQSQEVMQIIENCVRTIKNLDPADQRFTLFRKNLKTIRTLLAGK